MVLKEPQTLSSDIRFTLLPSQVPLLLQAAVTCYKATCPRPQSLASSGAVKSSNAFNILRAPVMDPSGPTKIPLPLARLLSAQCSHTAIHMMIRGKDCQSLINKMSLIKQK